MTKRTIANRSLILVTALTPLIVRQAHAQTKTYLIEQNLDYPSTGSCSMLAVGNVNDDTSSLVSAMGADGWTGYRFTEPSAWPQDFYEHCGMTHAGTITGGLDSTYADAKTLAYFSGHGGQNWMIWSRIHNGECTMNLTYHTALGMADGAKAAIGIFDSCSSLASVYQGLWDDVSWNAMRQELGFSAEAVVGNDAPRDFYNATASKTNVDAWLDEFASTSNKPTVLSMSTVSWGDCYYTHNNNKLKANIGNTPLLSGTVACGGAQRPLYYCASWRG